MLERHTLEVTIGEHDLMVQGDEIRLMQVRNNLLDNAVSYSPRGGPVHLMIGVDDGWVCIAVRNHGMGFPASPLTELLQPFLRTSNVDAK